jgi:polycystin 2
MLLGVFEYEDLHNADPVVAPVFFVIYMLLFTYILSNIFIAILENAYSSVKGDMIGEEDESLNVIRSLLLFCVNKWKKKRKPTEEIESEESIGTKSDDHLMKPDMF